MYVCDRILFFPHEQGGLPTSYKTKPDPESCRALRIITLNELNELDADPITETRPHTPSLVRFQLCAFMYSWTPLARSRA